MNDGGGVEPKGIANAYHYSRRTPADAERDFS